MPLNSPYSESAAQYDKSHIDTTKKQPSSTYTVHIFWTSSAFFIEYTAQNTISLSTILTLLAKYDKPHVTSPINETKFNSHTFKTQVDGGSSRSVINNRNMLHVSWEMTPYMIGGIRDRLVCTSKGEFHIIYDDGSVLPGTMFYSQHATKTVILPIDVMFPNMGAYNSW